MAEESKLLFGVDANTDQASRKIRALGQEIRNAVNGPGMAQGSLNALSGINAVRGAQRTYAAQRQVTLAIRESQAAARRLYDFAGNPFLVVSSLTSSISGIKQIRDGLEQAADMMTRGSRDAAQYKKQLQMLRDAGISKTSPMYKQINAQLREANKEKNAGIALDKKLIGQTKGPGFIARSIADFGLQQLATGAMFTFAFQGAAMVMEGVANNVVKAFTRITNPAKEAAESFNKLAASVKAVGGTENLQFFTKAMIDIADAAEKASANQPAIDAIVAALDAIAQKAVTGLGPAEAENQASRNDRINEILSSFIGIDFGPIKMIDRERVTAESLRKTLADWPKEASDAFFKYLAETPRGLFGPTSTPEEARRRFETLGVVDLNDQARYEEALRRAAGAALDAQIGLAGVATESKNLAAEENRAATLREQREQLLFEKATLLGEGFTAATAAAYGLTAAQAEAYNAVKVAKDQVTAAQDALDAFQNRQQDSQIRAQRQQAQARVLAAGVALPGQTGFEVAAAILEAKAQKREVETQIALQIEQNTLMQAMRDAQETYGNAQQDVQLENINVSLKEVDSEISKLPQAFRDAILGLTVTIDDGVIVGRVSQKLDSASRYGTPIPRHGNGPR